MKDYSGLALVLTASAVIAGTAFAQEGDAGGTVGATPGAGAGGVFVATPGDYIIGAGDVLDVRVAGEPDLTGTYAVRFDGVITYPYVGEITAAGVGLGDFNRTLRERLGAFYKDPQVTVEVKYYNSCIVYVLGEVEKPGVYDFRGRATLLEIIAKAGGFKHTAARASTMVVRAFPDKAEVMRIDMERVIDEGAITLNVPIAKGDVVVVPKTFIADLNTFLDDITPGLSAYLRANTIYQTDWSRNP